MGRPKKLQNVEKSKNGTMLAESNEVQFDSTIGIEDTTKFSGKHQETKNKEHHYISSIIEFTALSCKCSYNVTNASVGKQSKKRTYTKKKQSTQVACLEKNGNNIEEVTSDTIVEKESDELQTACHNKGMLVNISKYYSAFI